MLFDEADDFGGGLIELAVRSGGAVEDGVVEEFPLGI